MLSGETIGGFFILYFSCCLASAGGIGGGGLAVPILLVFFGFEYHDATILSLCTVLGSYIIQSVINWGKHHPQDPSRPMIYWDAVLVLLPAQIGGSNIGVFLGRGLPATILMIFSILVLILAGTKTFIKGIHLWKDETKNGVHNSDVLVLLSNTVNSFLHTEHTENRSPSSDYSQQLIINTDKVIVKQPKLILSVLCAVWIAYAAIFVTSVTAVPQCSVYSFVLLGITYPILIITIIWAIRHIAYQQQNRLIDILDGYFKFTSNYIDN